MLAAAAATPGFWDWSFEPPLVGLLVLALLYAIGSRRTVTPQRTRGPQRWRDVCFYASLLVLAVALCSPLDILSERLFWVHMVQHILLLVVAAPMLVLSRPWIRLWRALPLSGRRSLSGELSAGRSSAPLRAVSRFLGTPAVAFVLFTVVLLVWHIPFMFDATLRSTPLHALEHTLFFTTAVMFWKQVIDSPPLRASLPAPHRVLYVIGAMVVMWALAVVLALAPHALYSPYSLEAARPGGISAIADQHVASGIMWVPGSITFVLVIFAYVHRWLMPPAPGSHTRSARLASEH